MYSYNQIDSTYDVHRDIKYLCVAIGDLECMIIDSASPKYRRLVPLRSNVSRSFTIAASFVRGHNSISKEGK